MATLLMWFADAMAVAEPAKLRFGWREKNVERSVRKDRANMPRSPSWTCSQREREYKSSQGRRRNEATGAQWYIRWTESEDEQGGVRAGRRELPASPCGEESEMAAPVV